MDTQRGQFRLGTRIAALGLMKEGDAMTVLREFLCKLLQAGLVMVFFWGALSGCGRRAGLKPLPGHAPGAATTAALPTEWIEVDGLRASIREAVLLPEVRADSVLGFGQARKIVARVSGRRVLVGSPLKWPEAPATSLYLEIAAVAELGGSWAYRCLFADDAIAIDSQHRDGELQELLPDPSRGSLLVDLAQVFGQRGELQSAATRCEVRVWVRGRAAVVFVLRAISPKNDGAK